MCTKARNSASLCGDRDLYPCSQLQLHGSEPTDFPLHSPDKICLNFIIKFSVYLCFSLSPLLNFVFFPFQWNELSLKKLNGIIDIKQVPIYLEHISEMQNCNYIFYLILKVTMWGRLLYSTNFIDDEIEIQLLSTFLLVSRYVLYDRISFEV